MKNTMKKINSKIAFLAVVIVIAGLLLALCWNGLLQATADIAFADELSVEDNTYLDTNKFSFNGNLYNIDAYSSTL